jgi:hypothetical protein
MAPSPAKPVKPLIDFQEKAALLVVVADDVGDPEVEVKVKEDAADDDGEVGAPVMVLVVVGTGEKDKVGCPDATLQNAMSESFYCRHLVGTVF